MKWSYVFGIVMFAGLMACTGESSNQDPIIVVKNASTLLHATDESTARALRYWIEGSLIRPDDVVCDIVNFRDLPETLVEFYVEASLQVFRTWLHDTGQQFVTLDKGPDGHLGMTRLVEFTNEVPFVRVQPPSSTGDS
jgi:hypothetical protein